MAHCQAWICETCGTQFEPAGLPPECCPICIDERQYVGWQGQRWITRESLIANYVIDFADEGGITTLRIVPDFAIGQRAFLLPHDEGFVMWECLSMVTPEAVARIVAMGQVTAIAISHPHFYSAMVDWSDALGGVPIFLHAADREWVQRHDPKQRFWEGEGLDLADNLRLIHLGGHFAGSTGLWWKNGPRLGGSLLPGDAIQVVADRTHTTFMYSYPNMIPLAPSEVRRLREKVALLAYEDVFGFTLGRQIIGDGKARVERSFDRYLAAVST